MLLAERIRNKQILNFCHVSALQTELKQRLRDIVISGTSRSIIRHGALVQLPRREKTHNSRVPYKFCEHCA